jgi:hypothetical protein
MLPGMLAIALHPATRPLRAGETITLSATYRNTGDTPLALAFWWQRSMTVRDAAGQVVPPGPGSVLPCGVAEDLLMLAPGESHTRDEPLACTQPAGVAATIGWSYALGAGEYTVVLVYEAPPAHGFRQHEPDPREFRGRAESNAVRLPVEPAPKGLLARLLGR